MSFCSSLNVSQSAVCVLVLFWFFWSPPRLLFTHLSVAQRHLLSKNAHRPYQSIPRISLTCQLHLQESGRDWEQTRPVFLQPIQNPYFSRAPYFAGTVPCGTPSLRCGDLRGSKKLLVHEYGILSRIFEPWEHARHYLFFVRKRTRFPRATRYASVYRIFITA